MEGNLRFAWVIGCTWAGGGTAAAGALYASIKEQTQGEGMPQLSMSRAFPDGKSGDVDKAYVISQLLKRGEEGGLALVQQDLYPQALTELADIVLPAAGWGEAAFSRMQGERRLRHYPKLADPPGEAQPDWWIVAKVARAMGFSGFSWSDQNEVFEAAGEASRGGIQDYWPLVREARNNKSTATELLNSFGTEGLQCPIKLEDEELVGTVRLHESGFATPTGKALFVEGSWDDAEARQNELAPTDSEMWIINRRAPGTWSSMVEDYRNPYRINLWSESYVEIHPDDLARLGINDGDRIRIVNDTTVAVELEDIAGTRRGQYEGVAQATDRVPLGVAYTHFNFLGEPGVTANSAVSNEPDPINRLYSFKLGKGRIVGL
jgi:arsenite oxidase large subunit